MSTPLHPPTAPRRVPRNPTPDTARSVCIYQPMYCTCPHMRHSSADACHGASASAGQVRTHGSLIGATAVSRGGGVRRQGRFIGSPQIMHEENSPPCNGRSCITGTYEQVIHLPGFQPSSVRGLIPSESHTTEGSLDVGVPRSFPEPPGNSRSRKLPSARIV